MLLGFILLAGAALRGSYLAEMIHAPDFTVPHVDADLHDYWARGIAFGEWAPLHGNPDPELRTTPYFRPPGYPYFLALVYKLTGHGYVWPRIVQMLIGLLNTTLAYLLARRILGRACGYLLASFMASYWIFIFFEGEFQEPALFILVLLVLLHVLLNWLHTAIIRWAVLAGLLVGLCGLIRPNSALLLPLLWIWTAWVHLRRRHGSRAVVKTAIFLTLGSGLAIAPVTIRNWIVARDFVPISTNGGINLLIGNNQRASGLVYAHTDVGVLDTCYDWPEIVRNLEHKLGRPLKHSEVSRYFTQVALSYMASHPVATLKLLGRKTLLYWGPSEAADNKDVYYERQHYPILRIIPLGFPLALSLGLLGSILFLCGRPRPGDPDTPARYSDDLWQIGVLSLSILVFWWLSFLPFAMTSRYRVPIIPLLLLFGVFFVLRLWSMLAQHQVRNAAIWTGALLSAVILFHVNFAGYEPSNARWHYQRGISYTALGDNDAAIREYYAALRCNPNYVAVMNDLGAALASSGRISEAVPLFLKAAERNPESYQAHFNLGAALELLGHPDESYREYMKALQINPHHVGARQGAERVERELETRRGVQSN